MFLCVFYRLSLHSKWHDIAFWSVRKSFWIHNIKERSKILWVKLGWTTDGGEKPIYLTLSALKKPRNWVVFPSWFFNQTQSLAMVLCGRKLSEIMNWSSMLKLIPFSSASKIWNLPKNSNCSLLCPNYFITCQEGLWNLWQSLLPGEKWNKREWSGTQ